MCYTNINYGYDIDLNLLAFDGMEMVQYFERNTSVDMYAIRLFNDSLIDALQRLADLEDIEVERNLLQQDNEKLLEAYSRLTGKLAELTAVNTEMKEALHKTASNEPDCSNSDIPF